MKIRLKSYFKYVVCRLVVLRIFFVRNFVIDEEENFNVVFKVVVELKGFYGFICLKVSWIFNLGNFG